MTRGADDALAEAFERQRERLVGVAHRMLGSRPDAEDAVQDTWLRLARQDAVAIDNLAGWLTRVVGRRCIDVLRAREVRARSPFDQLQRQFAVTADEGGNPEGDVLLAESIELAMLVVLDSLTPVERLAFVLHDVFAVPFHDIAAVIGKTADATRTHASRARRKLCGAHSPAPVGRHQRRALVDAFLSAARGGDFEDLLRVLDPDVALRIDVVRPASVRLCVADVLKSNERWDQPRTASCCA